MSSSRTAQAAPLVVSLLEQGSLTGMTDEQLLERFVSEQDGEAERAFEALVQRHGPMVLSVSRGVDFDTHEAEDAFQAR